jgi:hypothetical protein
VAAGKQLFRPEGLVRTKNGKKEGCQRWQPSQSYKHRWIRGTSFYYRRASFAARPSFAPRPSFGLRPSFAWVNFTEVVPFESPTSANGALATLAFFAVCKVLISDFLLIVMAELLWL